jgi:hypothetical protein
LVARNKSKAKALIEELAAMVPAKNRPKSKFLFVEADFMNSMEQGFFDKIVD